MDESHSSLKNSFQKNIIMYRPCIFKKKRTLLHFSFFCLHLFLNEDRRQHFLPSKTKRRWLPFSILFFFLASCTDQSRSSISLSSATLCLQSLDVKRESGRRMRDERNSSFHQHVVLHTAYYTEAHKY
jgi:hypothetical protein